MNSLISRLFFFVLCGLLASLISCQSDPSQVNGYSDSERDTLLVNVITYMGRIARGANQETRFDPKFRSYYVSELPKYKFEKYSIKHDSIHYYFIIRPVGEGKLYKRGVGGKFRLNESLSPVDFEEMWCTPHFRDDSIIKERGGFLFSEMVREGNVDKYLTMKHYIEWPDSTLRYDKQQHEWVATGKTR